MHKLAANHFFCHELRYFENIMKKIVAFFLIEQSIVKDGELIYLFIHFLLLLFFFWLVDVFRVAVVFVFCFCFAFVMLAPGFKQGLRNKPPTHLEKNIVFQPIENCHNRNRGTPDKERSEN